MAQSPNGQSGNQSSVAPSSDLGANEWLVEEMKEQYDKDPGSVGPEWAAYFGNGSAAPAEKSPPAQAQTQTQARPQPATSQAPRKAPAKGGDVSSAEVFLRQREPLLDGRRTP